MTNSATTSWCDARAGDLDSFTVLVTRHVSVVVGTVDGRATPVEEVAAVVGVDVEELRAARAAAATRQTMVPSLAPDAPAPQMNTWPMPPVELCPNP